VKLSLLFESTSFLKYLIKKLPNTPRYVIKDWIYAALKDAGRGEEGRWSWSDLNESYKDCGPLDQMIWTLKPKLIRFEMDMFEEEFTQRMLRARRGGKTPEDFELPRDAERHQIQRKRMGTAQKAFTEPAILFFDGSKYELLEGWHRTIQAFALWGTGFKAMAYIGRKGD